MKYKIINSGSDGNATIIENIILVDCGVSFKKIENYFKKLKIVLLTHCHKDHLNSSTIKKLAIERPTLRFACCSWLVEELVKIGVKKKNIDVLKIGTKYDYGIFKIVPIKAYHDVPNCGYRIFINSEKIIYITDTNTLEGISAKGYDFYLIEGNYEESEIKKKIAEKQEKNEFIYEYRVEKTHLSKEQCNRFFIENAKENSVLIYMHEHKEKSD